MGIHRNRQMSTTRAHFQQGGSNCLTTLSMSSNFKLTKGRIIIRYRLALYLALPWRFKCPIDFPPPFVYMLREVLHESSRYQPIFKNCCKYLSLVCTISLILVYVEALFLFKKCFILFCFIFCR